VLVCCGAGCVVATAVGLGSGAGELVTAAGLGDVAGELLAATGAMGPWWLIGAGELGLLPATAAITTITTSTPQVAMATVARRRVHHPFRLGGPGGWTVRPYPDGCGPVASGCRGGLA
jgi:hypothetical protein